MIAPPKWSSEELQRARKRSEERFREGRGTEPLDVYLDLFDEYQGAVEAFLEQTVDLTRLSEHALELLSDKRGQEIFRYLSGPPVSKDDLKTLVKAKTFSAKELATNPELVMRLVNFMRDWHDRRRFVWLAEDREPSEAERFAAVLASAALLAMRRLETMRRNEGKRLQEQVVASQLSRTGFEQIPTRRVNTLVSAPEPGQFCRESFLGTRKADFIIGLWDKRTMPLECKVSNSTTNSIKRLNNDAAVKAETWRSDFGSLQVVPAAVLSGVYNLHNLEDAQRRGLTIFWAHDLQPMLDWLHRTKGG